MKLIPVSERPDAYQILWDLMAQAKPHEVISHRIEAMPSWDEHVDFIDNESKRRYAGWYLIDVAGSIAGWVYATKKDEIGIRLFETYQRLGIGPEAVGMLRQLHPSVRFANVNPANAPSIKMWVRLGFKLARHEPTQDVYALEAA